MMPGSTDGPTAEDPTTDARDTMEDVAHTHPDTDESFTDTGVYDRGKKHPHDNG